MLEEEEEEEGEEEGEGEEDEDEEGELAVGRYWARKVARGRILISLRA